MISLDVFFRAEFTCISSGTVNAYHSRMNTYLMIRLSIIDCMCKSIGQDLSDYRYRNLRDLFPCQPNDFSPPSDILKDILFSCFQQIHNIVLIELHIEESKLFISCKHSSFQSDRTRIPEKYFSRFGEVIPVNQSKSFQNYRSRISAGRKSACSNSSFPELFDRMFINLFCSC